MLFICSLQLYLGKEETLAHSPGLPIYSFKGIKRNCLEKFSMLSSEKSGTVFIKTILAAATVPLALKVACALLGSISCSNRLHNFFLLKRFNGRKQLDFFCCILAFNKLLFLKLILSRPYHNIVSVFKSFYSFMARKRIYRDKVLHIRSFYTCFLYFSTDLWKNFYSFDTSNLKECTN